MVHLSRRQIIVIVSASITIILSSISIWIALDIAETKRLDAESVILKDDLRISFGEQVVTSDFISALKGELINDQSINTEQLGKVKVEFEYYNIKHKKRPYEFTIEVVDDTAPKIYGSSQYTVPTGYQGDLTNLMLSADNLDDKPKREILGEYDLGTPGIYNLSYSITDASGNSTKQNFTLRVVKPTPSSNPPAYSMQKLPLKEVIQKHKTSTTKIGVDVSQWQGKIDWPAVKDAGIEFAFIRLGYQTKFNGEYTLDPFFHQNVQAAQAAGLPIGIYFYSYANTVEQAKDQAEWIAEQISDYNIELGVAFDWESWSEFNIANMSLYTINKVATTFLDTLESFGYNGVLYSSKVYLERIWQPNNYPVWLAQYYDRVTYDGDYWIWQMSNTGQVTGINGDVDLNIMYLDKN